MIITRILEIRACRNKGVEYVLVWLSGKSRGLNTNHGPPTKLDCKKILEADGVEVLWSGTVRLDRSLADCLNEPTVRDGCSVYAVRDGTYGKENNAQFDNPRSSKRFPNTVLVIAKGLDGADIL